ncbi:hypothetical protein FY528_03705 [Hymenobacter lutimineralis]|uniref:Lipocalin-like domain-containing protein n=1 Tax=Hymenobacter lutimineralis TaxID=2606448 RepID=A0A5D6VDD5_9BACT|nr:hypothetical protein [Hymenobacter lutimineralis]TYZ13526.1 hypothetical protein FY528_03705 [Hymenobacter lutimineralis]
MYTFWRTAAFGLLLTLTANCQKTDLAPAVVVDEDPAALRTQWVWVADEGGLSGQGQTPAPGYQLTLQFKADGTLVEYVNGQEIRRTTYARAIETTLLYHDQRDIITINPSAARPDMRYIIEKLSDGELVLREDVFDGFTRTFRAQQAVNAL